MLSLSSFLPHLNATLNAVTMLLLLTGFRLIRKGQKYTHSLIMLTALVVSALFLVSYLVYHFTVPIMVFSGANWIKPLYYTIMVTHIVLAIVVTPLAGISAWHALRGHYERHRLLARWTFPIWLYVSITGVIIYVILYHVYASQR